MSNPLRAQGSLAKQHEPSGTPSRRGFLSAMVLAVSCRRKVAPADIPAALCREHRVPGLSVAMARDGKMVFEQAFGWADQAAGEKLTPAHRFRIASISKPFTSVTLFRLLEEGRLKLDDLVFGPRGILGTAYGKPPYQPHIADLRIVHLMTHTGGGWTNDDHDPMFQHVEMNHAELIRWTLATQLLLNAPGDKYAYSNFGYCILGRIIEKLTGQPYDRYVQQTVLSPCGISDMRIAGNTLVERADREVVYYQPDPILGRMPYNLNVHRMDSHGGWIATASDLVQFTLHVNGKSPLRNILTPASIREMTTGSQANSGYAKGWFVNKVPNWWHSGVLPGTTALMVRTESGFCWSALANTRTPGLGNALDRMMWQLSQQFPKG